MGARQGTKMQANNRERAARSTHSMTNLRGLSERTGKRVKHMTKQARAARLQAPKINKRSHLLTATRVSPATPRGATTASHAGSRYGYRCMHMSRCRGAARRVLLDAVRLTHV